MRKATSQLKTQQRMKSESNNIIVLKRVSRPSPYPVEQEVKYIELCLQRVMQHALKAMKEQSSLYRRASRSLTDLNGIVERLNAARVK